MNTWTKNFEEIFGNLGFFYAESAKRNNNEFSFRLCIEAADSRAATGYGNEIEVSMYLVPAAESFCTKSLTDIMEMYGYKTKEEAVKNLNSQEVIAAGFAVKIAERTINYNKEIYPNGFNNVLEYADAAKMVDEMANMENYFLAYYPAILSREITVIGVTGYDVINLALTGEAPEWAAIGRMGLNNHYAIA